MRKLFTLSTVLLSTAVFFAQGVSQISNVQNTSKLKAERCGADIRHHQLMESDPEYKLKMDDFNSFLKKGNYQDKSATVYRVPVVVHVMHKGEAVGTGSNISDDAIKQGIRQLNERFRKVSGSLGDGNGEDVEIEFALAIRDSNNSCTNGIVRYSMTGHTNYMNFGLNYNNSNGMDESTLKGLSRWDPTKYYNIYLVYEIDDNECGSGIQGFAYLAGAHGNSVDGMVQLACKFAQSGNTTLTHELGHGFNLYHTFQGDGGGSVCPTGNGDFCADTPEHKRSSSNCVVATNTCTGGSSNEHIHNYMDYSSDACQNEFTGDQKTRMRAALTTTRASFLEGNGNQSLVPPAAPTADFSVSAIAACPGTAISFYDESSCIPNTFQNGTWTGISFSWTFENGTDTVTSTLQNPTITFANSGIYNVTLEVTNASGTNSLTRNSYVYITSSNPTAATCSPSSQNPSGNYGYTMSNLTFNTINNTTSSVTNGEYTDYACTYATAVTAGSSYDLTVTLNNQASFSEDVKVYIDYNDNGDFSDSGELIMTKTLAAGGGSGTYTESISIPGSAVTGKVLRMRAMADANGVGALCATTFVGDIEDYGVYIAPQGQAPVANFGGTPTTLCEGNTVVFSDSSTNSPTSWSWVFTGGTPSSSTAQNPTITYNTAGTYQVQLTATNASGNDVETKVGYITVNSCPSPPVADFGVDNTNPCEGTSISFSDSSTNSPTSWSWVFTGGTPSSSTAQNPTITYNTAGTYQVQLTATNASGNDVETKVGYITVTNCGTYLMAPFRKTYTSYSELLACLPVANAEQYEFEFTPSGGGAAITYQTVGTGHSILLNYVSGLVDNTTYDVRAKAKLNGTFGPYGATYQMTTPSSTLTSLLIGCGITFNSYNQLLACYPVSNAQQYEFEFTPSGGGAAITYETVGSGHSILLNYVSGLADNTAYDVRVRAKVGGTYGAYGNTCQITTPSSALTSLLVGCGITFSSYHQLLACYPVANAEQYEFEFTPSGGGGAITFQTVGSGHSILLSYVSGLADNTAYDVRVRAKVGGTYGAYGSTCQLTTPSGSLTSILIGCGVTYTTFNQLMACYPVANAEQYEFEFTPTGGGGAITYQTVGTGHSILLSYVTGLALSTSYDVRVRAKVGGTYGAFGSSCQMTTPASAKYIDENLDELVYGEGNNDNSITENNLEVTVYPNPGRGDFVYANLRGLSVNSQVIVRDISGKIMLDRYLGNDQENLHTTIRFKNKLSYGFYTLTVISGDNKVTKKLIVR